jgi:regulator of RNase E activity RraA
VPKLGDEDTVVLTPEEKDKILKDVPEEEQQDEDENED